MDLVVTVCDSAAAEACPIVFGDFLRAHWGLPDPAAVEGDDDAKREAFRQAHRIVKARLHALLPLPADAWDDRPALKQALDRIGFVEPDPQPADTAEVITRKPKGSFILPALLIFVATIVLLALQPMGFGDVWTACVGAPRALPPRTVGVAHH